MARRDPPATREAFYYTRRCTWCNQEYKAARRTSEFCGGTCRQQANRARNARLRRAAREAG